MPYARRYSPYGRYARSYRVYSRRRGMPSSAPTYGQIFSKVAKDVAYLKGLVNSELKHKSASYTTAVDSSGVIVNLAQVSQGDTGTTRDGSYIRLRSLILKGHWTINASATRTECRVIVFVWKRVGEVAPTVADILASASTVGLPEYNNIENMRILWDKTTDLSITGNQKLGFSKRISLNLKQHYKGADTGGDWTELVENGLGMLLISDEATNTPTPNINFRVFFRDN